ncbi:MAG: MBL fold metallo-hydrolase, partial [Candidatus Korarchaeota archaeon]|nr:MBL fold metallo-hydrolase [Candidatus Korarchaeota archaeon]
MLVRPLAFDSMGVRSMATYVETRDVSLLIDPGVALAPRRFGLPPHDVERERLRSLARVIEEHARRARILVVTHYHYDH